MSYYGQTSTWKVVYNPVVFEGGRMGVALVEAQDHHDAMYTFQKEYAGEYSTIQSCTQLFE
jgi:hypothetical protein